MKYAVIDNTNHHVRVFDSWGEAFSYQALHNRPDWKIVGYYPADFFSTPKQRAAIEFCRRVLNVEFFGDINSGRQCSKFLEQYLEIAKQHYTELKCEYETERGY